MSLHSDSEVSFQVMPTIFMSLLLVMITFFIVLTRFIETDPQKVQQFKKDYQRALFLKDKKNDFVNRIDSNLERSDINPLVSMINRMKAEGISEVFLSQYLSLNDIKTLKVISGEHGIVIRFPNTLLFDKEKMELNASGRQELNKIIILLQELPYIINIKGLTNPLNTDNPLLSLSKSVDAAQSVFKYCVNLGVPAGKLKVSGQISEKILSGLTNVEISFRENI